MSRWAGDLAGAIALGLSISSAAIASPDAGAQDHHIEISGGGKDQAIKVEVSTVAPPSHGFDWASLIPALAAGLFALLSAYYARVAGWKTESDRSLQEKRTRRYEKLLGLLRPLAKYPELPAHEVSTLRTLSEKLTDWYFRDAGGLYLSKKGREAYFDLQDGLKLAMLRTTEASPVAALASSADTDKYVDQARAYFGRDPKKWMPPEALTRLIKEALAADKLVPTASVELLRQLGSTLRTVLTEDLESRRRTSRVRG